MRVLPSANDHFDAVVIGSGFGGSVMAYRLADAGKRVCVLERGKRYPPGSFARTPVELRHNFWRPKKRDYGLFDVWSFDHIEAVVSAGVGGGSLIYGNVLIRKDEQWFAPDEGWPVTRQDLEPHYDAVECMLGPQVYPHAYRHDNKTAAMGRAADELRIGRTTYDDVNPKIAQWYLPLLAVTFTNGREPPRPGQAIPGSDCNIHGALRQTCRLCGECDVGCNYGSKNTLDYNYLSAAAVRRALICELCEAKTIAPVRCDGRTAYQVTFVAHDPDDPTDAARRPRIAITCDRLILACGTLGTTLLLLRNRDNLPNLSSALGKGFSGNGDYLAFARHCTKREHGTRKPVPLNASRAPVITSTFRFPDRLDGGSEDGRGFYLQDAGYPLLGDYLWEALEPVHVFRRMLKFAWKRIAAKIWHRSQTELGAQLEGVIGDAAPSLSSMPLLGFGRDIPDGEMTLRGSRLQISWRTTASKEYLDRVDPQARAVAEALGGRYGQNPLTRAFNRLITVHPLGGCRMGRSVQDAVVDSSGEVFNYPGLYVADGSVMPGPVGANPSFTIAALADRFATKMLEKERRGA